MLMTKQIRLIIGVSKMRRDVLLVRSEIPVEWGVCQSEHPVCVGVSPCGEGCPTWAALWCDSKRLLKNDSASSQQI